jgi:diguanylate cyclase (GGDEF)-like protein/PAS domain S-box-containing protein
MTSKRKVSHHVPERAETDPQPDDRESTQPAGPSVKVQSGQADGQKNRVKRKHNERLQTALYQISQATNSTHNLQELFTEIHQTLGELMPAKNFFIALHDPVDDVLSFPYFVDEHDDPPSPIRARRGLTEYVLQTGRPLLADPVDFDQMVARGEVESVGSPSIDWLGVPLIVQDRTIGVLAVQTYTEGVRFGEAERDLLGFVSNQVAMAIDRKRAEETLRINEARFRAIVEDQTELICRFLPDTTLTFVNEAYCRYYGKKREELIGTSSTALITPEDRPVVIAHLATLTRENPSITFEHRGINAAGVITWEQWSNRAIFDETGQLVEFQAVGRDITDRKKVEDELRYLSTHDRLTGIYNRAYFEEELTRLDHGRQWPVSVLMADVDGLKETNDTHGHQAGDELLRQTAEVLRSAFRSQDVVARIGGDEFGVLLAGAEPEVAQGSIDRIRTNLEIHNSTPGKLLIRLSLGYATAVAPGGLSEASRQADTVMYQEKFQMRAQRVQDILKSMRYDF